MFYQILFRLKSTMPQNIINFQAQAFDSRVYIKNIQSAEPFSIVYLGRHKVHTRTHDFQRRTDIFLNTLSK